MASTGASPITRNGRGEVIEIRRAESGARFWASRPGEYYMSFTGEYGGLWKRIGRPPQGLVGIGTFATGFDTCGWYVRQPGADDPRANWIMEGVDDDVIGKFGVLGNGAAGIELDGADIELGSPADIVVLASSTGHSAYYMQSPDEVVFNHAAVTGDANPRVRADMTYFTLPDGSAVFSTGLDQLGREPGSRRLRQQCRNHRQRAAPLCRSGAAALTC